MLPLYEYKRLDNPENLWFKKTWGTELDFWTYNPNAPTDDLNPNDPIGTVICTILQSNVQRNLDATTGYIS